MKVRQSSWHYQLWQLGHVSYQQPRDLCRYFWHIVLFKLVLPLAIVVMALVGVGWLLWLIYGHPVVTGIVLLGAVLVIAAVVGLFFLIRHLHDRHVEKRDVRRRLGPPPKEPSVLKQYLVARKRKLCPLIEVVDDRESA